MSETYDVIIIGGGPAGLTAGLYTSRANMRTLLLESAFKPSLITTTDLVENYPGFPEGISGFEIVQKFAEQAGRFGLETVQDDVTAVTRLADGGFRVTGGQGSYAARAIILATGADPSHLNVPGEERLTGRGVSYCATCDGPFYRGRDLVVVGGGDTAIQEALFLTNFASSVTVVHRRDRLRATGVLQDRAFANEKIKFAWNRVVAEIRGENEVEGVTLADAADPSKTEELGAEGVFIFTGYSPNTTMFDGLLPLDDQGYIPVDRRMQTPEEGIFACGDCTGKLLRQVVTACGDGATAAFAAQLYVEEQKGTAYADRSSQIKA